MNTMEPLPTKLQPMELPPMRGEVAPRESGALATRDRSEELLRYAIDKGASVETIERLMNVRRELRQEQAKQEFDLAMAAFQSECPVIAKEKGVPDRNGVIAYKYAPIEFVATQIKPWIQKHGFSYSFDTDTESQPGWVIVKCLVTHSGGHSRVTTAKFPLGTKTGIMSDTQVYASALTFANRRALSGAFGLILAGEDMDGGTGKLKQKGPSSMEPSDPSLKPLKTELWNLLKPVRGDKQNWAQANQWLWREEILDGAVPEEAPNLTAAKFREVIAKAREALK